MVPREKDYKDLVPKVVSLREALHAIVEMMVNSFPDKLMHPKNWNYMKHGVIHPVNKAQY